MTPEDGAPSTGRQDSLPAGAARRATLDRVRAAADGVLAHGTDEEWTIKERANMRADVSMALQLARESVQVLFENSGATGIQDDIVVHGVCATSTPCRSTRFCTGTTASGSTRVLTGGEPLTPPRTCPTSSRCPTARGPRLRLGVSMCHSTGSVRRSAT